MKKYFLSLVAIAAMLFATSCQESLVEPQLGGTTTFTVQVPDQMGTKALGSKANVNQLFVAVYADASADNAVAIYRDVVSISGGQATVSLDLVQGQKYDLVFWAQVDNNYVSSAKSNEAYQFELVNIPMNKNYHNTDAGAAFFYYWDNFQPTGTSQPVTLRRPFAQLNLGTTEGSLTNNAGTFKLKSSEIQVKGIADNFNTVSGFGTVAEANKEKVYTFIAVENSTVSTSLPLDQTIKVAEVDYKYVSMDYLPIVGDDQALVTVKAEITLDNNQVISHEFTNVPVRENYRTNIVGNLISSTTDFNVVVDDRFVDENNDNISDDNNILVVENAAAAQTALDNAKPGDVITLVAGVNYGTLKFRANPGHINTTLEDIADAWRYNYNRSIEDITIIGAEGATVDQFKFETGALPGDCNNRVTVNNLVIDGVVFTDDLAASAAGYNAPIMITTTNATIDGLTVKNCKLIGDNSKLNLVYLYGADGSKNVSLINNKVEGIARLCELRGTEKVILKGNEIKNTYEHAMLLAAGGYADSVTITGNTADGIRDRFVRMAGAENATVYITKNTITNYQGADADYIKVTDANNVIINGAYNVTIENNTLTSRIVPAGNTDDIVLNTESIEVTVPASPATTEEVSYRIEVKDEDTVPDANTGKTTIGFNLTMYKNNVEVSDEDVIYKVTKKIGEGLIISKVTHNLIPLEEANTGDDQTYTYDSATGILTIYTESFSPFEIVYYNDPVAKVGNKEYGCIDDAIAAWTNNTTLTLLADVTLSDVITLKSTEHHILNLSTFTMTAASGKNAFVIKACGTGDSERTAITINADATNPGGVNAGSKSIIYYKYADGGISGNDRPIIKINGGIFTGSTSSFGTAGIYVIGSAARKAATINISGGTFNCSINGSGKSKLLISGGVFHYSVGSQGDSTALRLIWGGRFKSFGFMTADTNNTKFWIGTAMAKSDVGVYVDDEGYFVIGGPVITQFENKFEAMINAEDVSEASNLLQYSSAATYGLYYTKAQVAIDKFKNKPNVEVVKK